MRRNHRSPRTGSIGSHLPRQAAIGLMATAAAAAGVAFGPAASAQTAAITPSASSGPVGTVVSLHGNAGPGCAGQAFFGFQFGAHPNSGPLYEVTVPVAANGSWNATFKIPSFLPGAATLGLGAPTTPGRYLISAPLNCSSHPLPLVSVPFTVTPGFSPSPTSAAFVGIAPTGNGGGYWLAEANGGVRNFGNAASFGSLTALGIRPASPIVGIAATPDSRGYWLVGADGGVFAFGDARSLGSLPGLGIHPRGPIVGIASTRDGKGYWLAAADGGVFTFGDAAFAGTPGDAIDLIDAIGATGAGGYSVSSANGGRVFGFPGTIPSGGTVGTPLSAILTGAAFTTAGGAWQVGLDGGVMTSGNAPFLGSLPGIGVRPAAPITGIAATPDARGYWLLGSDGGVFSFGDAGFHGSGA